ncbi:hypothetical protein K1719_004115 [Acacia pycnantha]|nr:hypothetical protein K1719_004115 [Acacia pycnantha]
MNMEVDRPKPEQQPVVKAADLFKAAENGDVATFQSLSPENLSKALSLRNEDERSLLHVAASSGHTQVVKILASAVGSTKVINSADEEGWAPIHAAASIGNLEIVDKLLDKGADVNLQNNGGRTAFHYAASKGWMKIAEILISYGAKINVKDKVGSTPLHRAAGSGNSEMCEFLIEEGADVHATDRAGQTPLMNAVIFQNREVAFLLIRYGADLDAQDKEGYTVLGRASNELRPTLVEAAKTRDSNLLLSLLWGLARVGSQIEDIPKARNAGRAYTSKFCSLFRRLKIHKKLAKGPEVVSTY